MTTAVPLHEQIACVRRELAMRTNAYPRWIASSRMTQELADREIKRMNAVLDTLLSVQAAQQPTML